MYIEWYGQSCFKIQGKNNGRETVIITDPYSADCGLRPPRFSADIVTISHDHNDHSYTANIKSASSDKNFFLVTNPGEYEVNDISIYGINSWHDSVSGKERGKNTIFVFTIENIKIAHLGDFGQSAFTAEQLEKINNIDVLIIPIGGHYTIGPSEAQSLIAETEPRVVIPMHYKIPGLKLDLLDLDKFIKEMGQPQEKTDRLKIAKKDLPQEESKFIVLEPR